MIGEPEILPVIAQPDYPAFVAILNDELPDKTWQGWNKRHKDHVADLAKKGQAVNPVPVNSGDFSRYLDRTGKARNLESLADFAADLAGGYRG